MKIIPPAYKKIIPCSNGETSFFIRETDRLNYFIGCEFKDIQRTVQLNYYKGSSSEATSTLLLVNTMNHLSLTVDTKKRVFYSNGSSIVELKNSKLNLILDSLKGRNNNINNIYFDSKSNLWISTSDLGVLVFKNGNLHTDPVKYLENESVSGCFEDKDGGIWISTVTNGVYYIPSAEIVSYGVTRINYVNVGASGFFNNNSDNYATFVDWRTGKAEVLDKQYSWFCYRKGPEVVIGASDSYIYNTETKRSCVLYYSGKKATDDGISLRCITNLNNDYFIGVDNTFNSVVKINKHTGECSALCDKIPRVFAIEVVRGRVYLGTKVGLYYFNLQAPLLVQSTKEVKDLRIVALCSFGDTLVVATKSKGVYGLKNGKIIFELNEKNGLLSNICKSLCADEHTNLWIGTNKGLSCFVNQGYVYGRHKNLTTHDGLNSNEINAVSCGHDTIAVATNRGVNYFNSTLILNKRYTIPVCLEELVVNNKSLTDFDTLDLEYNQNNIRFFYKALFPKQEGEINYMYKLIGLDSNWNNSSNTGIQYTSLPPGEYEFVVKVLRDEGDVSNPVMLKFKITKPFWLTWWFVLLCIGVGVLLLFIAYRIIVIYIRKVESKKNRVQLLIIESELKALRSQMNPHFIFNALNSIQNFVIKNESVSAQKYLTKFSRLIRAVLENSRNETILLSKEIETLDLYMELESLRASFGFDYEVVVDAALLEKSIYVPTMLFQPFIENAILHGVMPLSGRRGKIEVSFRLQHSTLICRITDNGIGREKAMDLKKKKDLNRQSLGMEVTGDRINYLNKYAQFLITLTITDNYNEQQEATGTEVLLEIINQQHERINN